MQRIVLFGVFFFSIIGAMAQDFQAEQRKLEQRKEAILKEIQEVRTLLRSEKNKERDILKVITSQNKKIALTQELLATSQKEHQIISKDISVTNKEITTLQNELEILKQDYAKTIVKSYKARSEQSRILFLLSSDNFLQAYKRFQYMRQYANFRKKQGDEIKFKTQELEQLKARLEVKKNKQQQLIVQQQNHKKELEQDKSEQQQLMTSVKKDQKLYTQQIYKKQQETKQIDKQIQVVIQKAIAEANRKAREKAQRERLAREKKTGKKENAKTHKSTGIFEMTPEERILADNFRANKGRLPWPVSKGFISLRYGDQPHPDIPTLTIHNSGIEISAPQGSEVRAVYKGEVINVQLIGGKRAVFIRHGEYITVYQNLSSSWVKAGQMVSTKQIIGTIAPSVNGQAVLKFVLTQNATYNNPELWLSRK